MKVGTSFSIRRSESLGTLLCHILKSEYSLIGFKKDFRIFMYYRYLIRKVLRDSERQIENEVPTFVFCPWELSYFDFMD